jgi:ribose transport system ATP-binding protein
VGQNDAGVDFALSTLTACFLGGAVLSGGRGTFVGAVLGALFVQMLINVVPLLGISPAYATGATGLMMIVAVVAYSASDLVRRLAP